MITYMALQKSHFRHVYGFESNM